MNDWQRSFVGKLESAKKHWLGRFEHHADETIEPAFDAIAEFTGNHGFTVSAPSCESGTRLYKFGLTENGYLLVTFRLRGLEKVEASVETVVPGMRQAESATACTALADLDGGWVSNRFQQALDSFVAAFAEASQAERELVRA